MKEEYETLVPGDLIMFKRPLAIYNHEQRSRLGGDNKWVALGIAERGDLGFVVTSEDERVFIMTRFGFGLIYRDLCDHMRLK